MTEQIEKEGIERRLAGAELKFERRFARLQAANETRFTALEKQIKSIHSMLSDIRTAIDEDFEVFSSADQTQRESIEAILGSLDEIEDRLGPIFQKLFPRHDAYLDAMIDVMEKAQRKEG